MREICKKSQEQSGWHNFVGGYCVYCDKEQNPVRVESIKDAFQIERRKSNPITEIWAWFGKHPRGHPLGYGALSGINKKIGYQGLRMCWRETVVDNPKDPQQYFLWRVKEHYKSIKYVGVDKYC